jgi:uncharacterized protein with gpF-like domain
MALNDNKKEIMRRAARDLALKLRLESLVKPSLKRFFKEIIKVFRLKYSQGASQEVINVDDYQAELVGILRQHYRRVARAFISLDQEQIKMLEKKDAINDAVNTSMSEYILIHSETQSKVILQTVKNELDEAILKTIQESIRNQVEPDPAEIARLVTDDFVRKIDGKAEIIAITETQNIAEKTKDEEYRSIIQSGDPTADLFVKQWVSILDGKTRPWHAAADGQRVAINQPFIVKGERLMYPGDTSFGVSLDNIINCRCSHLLVRLDS